MTSTINTYIAVDPLWSYEFVGGLKDYIELDLKTLDDVYRLVGLYITHRHKFFISDLAQPYNMTIATLNAAADGLGIPAGYFQFYCDRLFRSMLPSFAQLRHGFEITTPINNETGDITAFVVQGRLH